EIQQSVRDDLILVVMSATMEAEPVARFLGGCPILQAEGRAFPVELDYLPPPTLRVPLHERVVEAVDRVLTPGASGDDPGDILVFLPGPEEIRRAGSHLEPLADR